MDAFSTTGFWWLPSTPAAQVAGSLHFDPSDGTQLNLLGTLTQSADALHTMLSEERRFDTVHGVADGTFYTLIDCLCTGSKLQFPGFQSEDYSVRLWLRGSALVEAGTLFSEMVLEYEYLDEWAGVGRLGVQSIPPTQPGEVHSYTVSYEEIGSMATLADGTTIELHTSHPGQFGHKAFQIQSDCQFHVKSPKPLSLEDLGKLAGRCQNFVTLLCDDPSAIKNYTVIAEGGVLLEVGSQFVFVRHGPTPNRAAAQMLRPSTLADFGILMATWFALYETNDRAFNTYFGLVYAPPTYTEIRFVTAAIAAEGLHGGVAKTDPDERIKTRERKGIILAAVKPVLEDQDYAWVDALLKNAGGPNLRRRLYELWQLGNGSTMSLIPNGGEWAKSITHERNNLSHPGRRKLTDLQLFIGYLSVLRLIGIVIIQKLAEDSGIALPDPATLQSTAHLAANIRDHIPLWVEPSP